jgi:hypothetical protein
MSMSAFANQLVCKHCGKRHGTSRWPVHGDLTPLYFQSEPGNYTLNVTCPHCGKPWYVVWDVDPGPIEELTGVARHETLGEAMGRTGASAEGVLRSWLNEARGVVPAGGTARKKCDICIRVQDSPEPGWRTVPHREVKASADLVSYAIALKLFGAQPDGLVKASIPEPVRLAWIAQIEGMFGESDWLLCPQCSLKIETKCDVCDCKQTYPSGWRHKLTYKIDSGTTRPSLEAGDVQGLDAMEERITMTGHPVNWRPIAHEQLKASPVLLRKAVRQQNPRLTDEQVTREVKDAWVASIEGKRGDANWLLCPDCSHSVGDFEERHVRIEQEAARGYRVAAEEAQADAEMASGSARRSAAQANRIAAALGEQFEALKPSLGARAGQSLAFALISTAKPAADKARSAADEAQDSAAKVKPAVAEAVGTAHAVEGMYQATVEGELEKFRKERSVALRKKAKELNIQIAAAAGRANALANTSLDAFDRARQAAKQVEQAYARLKLAVAYGLADSDRSPDEEFRVTEPTRTQLDLLVSALGGITALCALGFVLCLGFGSGVLAVLTLLAAIAAGGAAIWLHIFSPWRRLDNEEKQRQIASQLPGLLEQTMLRRLLDEASPPPESTCLAVQRITELAKSGRAAVAELTRFLAFKGDSPTDEAYVRWRAARALEQLGVCAPLDPMQVFRADIYLKTKTIAWRDEAAVELARIAKPASKAVIPTGSPTRKGPIESTPPSDGPLNQPAQKSPVVDSAATESATIRFNCPGCGKPIIAPARSEGKQAHCPKCKAALTIPTSVAG